MARNKRRKRKGPIRRLLSGIVTLVALVVVFAVAVVGWGHYYRTTYEFDAPSSIERTDGGVTVIADGNALYDENGDIFHIQGINFGNLFLAEGWMTVNSVGPLLNEDGSFVKVNKDNIVEEYEEIFQEEMDAILADRFTDEQIEALNDAYFSSYCTEADFKLIADMGLNTIRLPMYYRNFLTTHDRYRLSDEQLCEQINFATYEFDFDKLDWFLEMAAAYDLKVIIDMHGVMGGQSGFEHCGTRDIDFWDTPEYIEFMCKLWATIADRYSVDGARSDLAPTVLAYDLVNEPTNRKEIGTGPKQWAVMDAMYQAIRTVDEDHVISIEGVWYFCSLPNPERFGWENVLYQYHFYNWNSSTIPNWLFYDFMYALYSFSDYDVPKLVGEFNLFGEASEWDKYLQMYDDHGLGWTIWSYKTVSVGWWDSSWGLVVNRMYLDNKGVENQEDFRLKLDLNTASYEEIYELWSNQYTEYTAAGQTGSYKYYDDDGKDNQLYTFLKNHFEKNK